MFKKIIVLTLLIGASVFFLPTAGKAAVVNETTVTAKTNSIAALSPQQNRNRRWRNSRWYNRNRWNNRRENRMNRRSNRRERRQDRREDRRDRREDRRDRRN